MLHSARSHAPNVDQSDTGKKPGASIRLSMDQLIQVNTTMVCLPYPLRYMLVALLSVLFAFGQLRPGQAQVEKIPRYVGSSACMACHEKEYKAFTAYAKKSSSFQSIERLRKELAEEEIRGCYSCHTTGFGKPGGFVSEEETPDLKNAGCEVCHGPGEFHVRTQSLSDIKGHLTEQDCEVCHTSERVKAFRYKPLIRGGAH